MIQASAIQTEIRLRNELSSLPEIARFAIIGHWTREVAKNEKTYNWIVLQVQELAAALPEPVQVMATQLEDRFLHDLDKRIRSISKKRGVQVGLAFPLLGEPMLDSQNLNAALLERKLDIADFLGALPPNLPQYLEPGELRRIAHVTYLFDRAVLGVIVPTFISTLASLQDGGQIPDSPLLAALRDGKIFSTAALGIRHADNGSLSKRMKGFFEEVYLTRNLIRPLLSDLSQTSAALTDDVKHQINRSQALDYLRQKGVFQEGPIVLTSVVVDTGCLGSIFLGLKKAASSLPNTDSAVGPIFMWSENPKIPAFLHWVRKGDWYYDQGDIDEPTDPQHFIVGRIIRDRVEDIAGNFAYSPNKLVANASGISRMQISPSPNSTALLWWASSRGVHDMSFSLQKAGILQDLESSNGHVATILDRTFAFWSRLMSDRTAPNPFFQSNRTWQGQHELVGTYPDDIFTRLDLPSRTLTIGELPAEVRNKLPRIFSSPPFYAVFDLNDTLEDSGPHKIAPGVCLALKKVLEVGALIGIASDQTHTEMAPFLEKLAHVVNPDSDVSDIFAGPRICEGGCVIFDPRAKSLTTIFDIEEEQKIQRQLTSFATWFNDSWISENGSWGTLSSYQHELKTQLRIGPEIFQGLLSITIWERGPNVIQDPSYSTRYEANKRVIEKVLDTLKLDCLSVREFGNGTLRIEPHDVSKCKGAEHIAKKSLLDISRVIYFGDAENDISIISLIQSVGGIGICVGRNRAVGKVADFSTKSCGGRGVTEAIQQLFG